MTQIREPRLWCQVVIFLCLSFTPQRAGWKEGAFDKMKTKSLDNCV